MTACSLIIFSGCGDDGDDDDKDPEPTQTIAEIVDETVGLDSLKKFLGFYPDIITTLGGAGDFTVFAPDNNAFISLLGTPGLPPDVRLIDPAVVEGLLLYHVSSTRYEAADINPDLSIATLAGEPITFTADGLIVGHGTTEEIEILDTDIKATNGVIHTIKSVLISPSVGQQISTVVGTNAGSLLLAAAFTDLKDGILAADAYAAGAGITTLTEILAGETFHTVFAPTNDTFAAAAGVTEDDTPEEAAAKVAAFKASLTGEQWYGIIANHVVLDDVGPEDLTTGATFTTAAQGTLLIFNDANTIPAMNGLGIYIDSNGSVNLQDPTTFTTFDGEVALPNAATNPNGRIHVIAGILTPLP